MNKKQIIRAFAAFLLAFLVAGLTVIMGLPFEKGFVVAIVVGIGMQWKTFKELMIGEC